MIVLDMDSSESPTYGEQEGSTYNGHFGCLLFVFKQFGDVERCALRPGNVHSADGWRIVLEPVVARYRGTVKRLYFRGDAAFANPEMYEFFEAECIGYTIRLPANSILQLPQSRKILAEILAGVPDDEQAKIAGDTTSIVSQFSSQNSMTWKNGLWLCIPRPKVLAGQSARRHATLVRDNGCDRAEQQVAPSLPIAWGSGILALRAPPMTADGARVIGETPPRTQGRER